MSKDLLLICDPCSYPTADSDVAAFYRAATNETTTWHVSASALASFKTGRTIPAIRLPQRLHHADFTQLDRGTTTDLPLTQISAAFCRTLKPFQEGYLDRLQRLESSLRFLNRPSSKKRQMEAVFLNEVAGAFTPPTLCSHDPEVIERFIADQGTVVAKRSNSTQAQGVYRIQRTTSGWTTDHAREPERRDTSLPELLKALQLGHQEPLQFSRFLRGTTAGDKRVVVVDGTILGAFRRRSSRGHWVNNRAAGGLCTADTIGDDERIAIAETWPQYRAMGLRILGYDFLMNDGGRWCISEINAGNVGGFKRLDALSQTNAMGQLLSWIQAFAERPEALRLRPATASDHAAIAWIYQQAIDAGGITMDDRRFGPEDVALKRIDHHPRDLLLVAEKRDEVVGWGELKRYSNRAGYQYTAETSVYVHQSEQGRGIGSAIQRQLIQHARQQGDCHLVAKVVACNPDSVAFHQRHGYRIVGTQQRIGQLRNTWFDVVILELNLR